MSSEPSPEVELLQAHADATHLALRVLVQCLESSGALEAGEFAEALRLEMEPLREDGSDLTLAMLRHLHLTLGG